MMNEEDKWFAIGLLIIFLLIPVAGLVEVLFATHKTHYCIEQHISPTDCEKYP